MKKILIIFEIVIILGSLFSDDFWASFWAGNVVLELPFLIPYIIFISIKKTQITKNKQNLEKSEKETQLDSILQKCKQDGSLEDIEQLKNLVEQNIKTNGSDIEFLELKQKISQINNEEAEKYFKLGLKKKKEYDYDSAIEYFNKAINKNSKNAKYYYEKGLLYEENYNPNKAKEELNKAISIESDNALYYYTRAEINYFQQYYSVATNDYTKGYELDEAPSNDILNHMENCLSFFLHNGRPKAKHFYLYAQLLVNKKGAKDYTYKTAVNELDKAIKRESLSEYYILRVYARCKYLLTTKDKAFLDSEFESLINDLIKIKEKNDNGNNEPFEFLKTNYNQLLDWTKRKLIKRNLVLRLENLNKEIKDEIEANKINTAWLKINSNEEIKPREQAENYYIVAVDFFNKKQISKAKYYIQKAIEIFSLEKYSELLKQIINKENEKWNKKVTKAEKFLKNKKLEDAKIIYEELLKINPKSKDIQDKCNMINNSINQSEYFYKQGLKKFEEGNIEEAKKQIDSAIGINNEKQFLELLNNIVKYENFIDEFNKNNYQTAYKLINELINIYPNNNVFLEVLENTKQKLAGCLYQCSINYINDGSYDKAIQDIEEAIKIFSNNEDFKNVLNIANNKLVDIKNCNKGAILTLDGFDEEKAEQFIQDRKTMNWYDLDSFAKYFNLQPHEQVMIEERIVFPLKPQVKKGRTVDI